MQLEFLYKHHTTGIWNQCNSAAIEHMKSLKLKFEYKVNENYLK